MNARTEKVLYSAQKTEITEHYIYQKLARTLKDEANRNVLLLIAKDELAHYRLWKSHTGKSARPNWAMVWFYYLISRVFGISFGLKLMEHGENTANEAYSALASEIPDAGGIAGEEDEHEQQLLQMINEERLEYVGSMIRGLNDALVELTGAMAGFTLALQESRLVAMVGLITGIAACLSMACTEYLAIKSEKTRNPLKSAVYTGTTYVLTVLFLVVPYILIPNVFIALAVMIVIAVIIILVFNFYIAVARDEPFVKRFLEMVLISLGVAALSFGIGYLIREVLGVNI